jgi:DNA-binding FadR family transcriptional regulator
VRRRWIAEPTDPLADGTRRSERRTGRRFRGALAHHLGRAIVGGEIQPGERLTGEVAHAAALDVSRSAYREAIQVLTAKGLVESRTKAGTRVQPRSRWNLLDPDVLAWAFSGEPDLDFIRHLFELRSIVEPAAARLAATRRTHSDLTALNAALVAMRRHTLATEAGQAADRDFHDALLRATQNDALVTLSASIGAAVSWTTQFKQRTKALPRDPIPDHARVVEAVLSEDASAAESAMRHLIDLAFIDTRASLPAQGVGGDCIS